MRKLSLAFIVAFCSINRVEAQNLRWSQKSAPTKKETYAVAFSVDGKKVFSGSECSPTSLRIFDAFSGATIWDDTIGGQLMCAQGVKFNSNGSKVATLEEFGNLLIYDFTTPKPTLLNTVKTNSQYAFSLAFSPDGNKIVTGCSDKKLIIYDAGNAAELHNIDAHANWVNGVDWSSKNEIASCGDDMEIKIWDEHIMPIRTITGHTASVTCVKFTPDGNTIVSGSKDKTIKIWDIATGNLIRTLSGHTGTLKQIDISDDGSRIVSGAEDGTIRTWDFATGNQLSMFSTPGSGTVYSVDYAPNSTQYIAVGNSNGDVQVWDLQWGTIVEGYAPVTRLIYPNPCHNELRIDIAPNITSVTVSDISGRQYKAAYNKTGKTLNTATLTPGNYTLQIETSAGRETAAFTKQ